MINKLLFVTCGLVTASFVAVTVPQQPDDPQEARGNILGTRYVWSNEPPSTAAGRPDNLSGAGPIQYLVPTPAQRETDIKIAEAAKAVRQAKSEANRSTAISTLTELLRGDYDARLDGYEEYLNQLEAKLVEMRSKLKKRREAKDEMIKLRVKVLEAEAEDLGWPARMSGRLPVQPKVTPDGK